MDYDLFKLFARIWENFGQVIVRDHLWDTHDQIKIGLPNHLFGQVSSISDLSQPPART
jgi:hypothetical protein